MTLPAALIMKIPRVSRKNRVDRVLRVNNGLRHADHTEDKVVFLGTILLTGTEWEGTDLPHHFPGQGT
jgi:hypothetical protein